MKIKALSVITFFIISLFSISCKEDEKQVKQVVVTFKKEGELTLFKTASDSIIKTIAIEIADDEYQTQTGLMYRDSMKNSEGMLFVFPNSDYRSFYMKNTKIALDIIYIDKDKSIVSIQKNAKPLDETSLPSEAPAKYVLEINAGLSDQWQIERGDRIEFTKL